MMQCHLISHLSITLAADFVLCYLSEYVWLFLLYITSIMSFKEEINYEIIEVSDCYLKSPLFDE